VPWLQRGLIFSFFSTAKKVCPGLVRLQKSPLQREESEACSFLLVRLVLLALAVLAACVCKCVCMCVCEGACECKP